MAKVGYAGPIQLKDPDRNSESTAPQLKEGVLFDSRLKNRFGRDSTLTPDKIRKIRRDPTIKMMRDIILAPVVHTEWTIIANEKAPSDAKEFVESVFMPLRLHFLQTSFSGCIDFGWTPYEKVLQEKNGQIVYAKFKQLLQDYTYILIYLDTGDFGGFVNYPIEYGVSLREVILDAQESMNINFEYEGTNWYGESIFQAVKEPYDDWIDANNSAKRYNTKVAGAHWVVHFPVGKTSFNGVITDNQAIALSVITTLESNGAVCIPDDVLEFMDDVDSKTRGKWEVKLLSDSSNAQITFSDRQKYIDTLKVRAFGIPERAVLEGQFGTKAEAEVHSSIGLSTIDTKHRIVVDQLNKQAVNQLLFLNYGEEAVDTVKIHVAPLVDSRFSVVKEVYRMILQSPNTIDDEVIQLDTKALRDELSLPSRKESEVEELREKKLEESKEKAMPFGQNPEQTEENDADKKKGF